MKKINEKVEKIMNTTKIDSFIEKNVTKFDKEKMYFVNFVKDNFGKYEEASTNMYKDILDEVKSMQIYIDGCVAQMTYYCGENGFFFKIGERFNDSTPDNPTEEDICLFLKRVFHAISAAGCVEKEIERLKDFYYGDTEMNDRRTQMRCISHLDNCPVRKYLEVSDYGDTVTIETVYYEEDGKTVKDTKRETYEDVDSNDFLQIINNEYSPYGGCSLGWIH